MSLFKTCNFWSTHCGFESDDLSFDNQCIVLSSINSEHDKIIVGNHQGYVWIFQPKSVRGDDGMLTMGYSAVDQLIEMQLSQPVLQIHVGRLVSGSQNNFIGILHPRSLVVFNFSTRKGHTEHGDQVQLAPVYEHKLQRSAANFVIGPFGGVNKRDFACVQSLDGVLTFFEQEIFSFCCFLPEFLLPGPLVFVPRSDVFVTIGSDWNVHAYRYQLLSEAGVLSNENQTTGKRLEPDWTYELAESAIDMVSLPNNSFESYLVILGEHNFYCISDQGKLKFMKRFEFIPLCFYPYLLEPENKLLTLIVSDTKTLLVYENTTLLWSAQLEFLPVAILRGNFLGLQGGITILSEAGDLQCCYLGMTPSQYVVPPIANNEIDFAEAEQELQSLQRMIDSQRNVDVAALSKVAAERELEIFTQINPHLDECIFQHDLLDETSVATTTKNQMCTLNIELNPRILFDEIQIFINCQLPLVVDTQTHHFTKVHERIKCKSYIYQKYVSIEIISLNIEIVITCITNNGIPRVLRKCHQIPLKLVANVCAPSKEDDVKITLNTTEPVVPLSQLYPEFAGESALSLSSNAIGFISHSSSSNIVTILAAKSSQRYRIQCASIVSLNYLTEDLVQRLRKYFVKNLDFRITQSSSPLPTTQLLTEVDRHFHTRMNILKIEEETSQFAVQFRVIQKRLMFKFKERTPTPLTNLQMLLDDTTKRILESLENLEKSEENLKISQCRLSSALQLILLLVKLSGVPDKICTDLKSALNISVVENNEQGWEDIVDVNLNNLLRTVLAKSDKDKLRANTESLITLKDITKLKKHLHNVLERVVKNVGHISSDNEKEVFDENKLEENDAEKLQTIIPVGSRLGELRSERPPSGKAKAPVILKARKSKHVHTTPDEVF